jgi:hypothetical protein
MLQVLTFPLTGMLYLALKGIYGPINQQPRLQWIGKWLFYNDYLYFLSRFGFREQRGIVFDHLVPDLASYIPRREFEAWFHENGLSDIVISSRAGNSWRGFGVKGNEGNLDVWHCGDSQF